MPPLYTSPFPGGPVRAVWEAIINAYRSDPQLQSGGVTFQTWSGDPDEIKDNAFEDLPVLRISPDSGSLQWTDENRLEGNWKLRLDYAVAGTQAADLMDFSDAIRAAFLCNTLNLATFIPLGCFNWWYSESGWKPTLVCAGQGIASTSYLTVKLNVQAS